MTEGMIEIIEIISKFNSPWQVLGFAVIMAFIFGCLWLLFKYITYTLS